MIEPRDHWRERYYKRVPPRRTTIYSVVSLFFLCAPLAHAQQLNGTPDATAPRIVALDPRWTVTFTTPPIAPAGFDQQSAYVPLKGGEVLAIDLNEGRVQWTADLATTETLATGDGLVFAAADSLAIALDQRTGRTLWRTPVGAPVVGPLHWESGWVLASTEQGELIAMRAEDGKIMWRNPLGAPLAVTPTASGERVYASLRDGRVVALDLETGTAVWTRPLDQQVTGMLALEEQLLLGTRANLLHSVSLSDGRIRWSQKAGADVIGAPLADEQFIYFVAFDNVLRALSRSNGNLQWRRNLPSRPSGGPVRIDNVIVVPFSTNDIGAYLAETGVASFTIQAVGELAGAPFLRETGRPTAPRLIAMSREGALQGFAARVEPPPAPLAELPGAKAGS